jgi:hypothetical protein
MRKNVVFLCIFLFLNISVFCQSVDIPDWLKPGMPLKSVQQALRNSRIRLTTGEKNNYSYWDNDIFYYFVIDPEDGLSFYSISGTKTDLDFQTILALLTKKYGNPERDGDEYIWEIEFDEDWFLDISLYTEVSDDEEWINIDYDFW